jgi:hypothetical protein
MGAEEKETNGVAYRTPYVAGGMLFCEAYFLKELPFDPNLPFLFVGEEILHSIRFYTHGWDVFTPTEHIVFHEYTRAEKPKIWTDNPTYSDMPAFNKVKVYLSLLEKDLSVDIKFNMEKYGLGKRRTLEEYYKFAGIDIVNKKVYKNFCRENDIATEEDIKASNEEDMYDDKKEGFMSISYNEGFRSEYPRLYSVCILSWGRWIKWIIIISLVIYVLREYRIKK